MASVLIILDLNGILGRKLFVRDVAKGKDTLPPYPNPNKVVFNRAKSFILRPGIYELLSGLYIHGYDIAIWSSMPNNRVLKITQFLEQQSAKWAELIGLINFIWGRDQCMIEGHVGIKTIPSFLTDYYSQVCLIDDTIEKVKYNLPHNYYLAPAYDWSIYDTDNVKWVEREAEKVYSLMHEIIKFNDSIEFD